MNNRIEELRKAADLTQEELGKKVGVTKATINKYEHGTVVNIKRSIIAKLAEVLNTTPSYLLGWKGGVYDFPAIEELKPVKTVPLIGEIACGTPILAEENHEGQVMIDTRIHADFALRCKGDSMINARIYDGDLVFVHQQNDVENGEIAAVIIDGEATLKRVYKYENRIELRPENPMFPVLNYEGQQLADLQIIGKAVTFYGVIR